MGSSTDGEKKVAFVAYEEPLKQQAAKKSNAFKIALVASDCLLLGLQPVLVHLSKNDKGKFSFNPVSLNLLTELAKTAFALTVLLALGTGRPGKPMYASVRSFVADATHNKLLAVPAALYAVNNYLKFSMQLYFRPTTTKMLGNLKIFTIALLMRTVMKRRFSVIQYEALFLLVAGITVNQLQSCGGGGESLPASSLLPALLCIAGSVTVPSAASVYNEYALKKHMDTSVHLQNFFLYFYGAAFNLMAALVMCAAKGQAVGGLFSGLGRVTAVLIVNNAAQGILSSFFFKFADTILKKYSSTIATIFTALMSWAMFAHPLTANFAIGVSIVFVSMHQFFTFSNKGGKVVAGGGGGGGGGAAVGAGAAGGGHALHVQANGSVAARQYIPAPPRMLHSPSMEHFRVQHAGDDEDGREGAGGGALGRLEEGVEFGGGGSSSRAPLLPR